MTLMTVLVNIYVTTTIILAVSVFFYCRALKKSATITRELEKATKKYVEATSQYEDIYVKVRSSIREFGTIIEQEG